MRAERNHRLLRRRWELIQAARTHNRIAQVGHLERFNPAVRATVPLITQPMFFEVHRLSVFTPRSLDVDVVLDLMIHDLDVVLSFVNSPIKEIRAVGLPILSGKVDIANVRLQFPGGCIANLTASRVSTERVRKLRLFQPHEYISLDYSRQDAVRFKVSPPMKIDFAYPTRDRQLKMYHAVALGADANTAARLAHTYPKLRSGIEQRLQREALLTAVIVEDVDRSMGEAAYAIEVMEEVGMRVETVVAMPRIAQMAAEELGV